MDYKFTFYVGLNDKDSKVQEIVTLEATKICMNIVKKHHASGGTIFEADGFYIHDDGTIVIEKSLKIEVMFIDEATAHKIVDDIKMVLNQESVAVNMEAVTSQLW